MTERYADSYYRQLCEHLGVALIATDIGLNIQIWNDVAGRLFGAASEQMHGVPITSIFPRETRDEARNMLRRVLNTGEILSLEFQDRDARGKRRELIATFAAVTSDSGERLGASACIRDITHRIDLQCELDESRKMIALGELAGTIAHHFNNILGGIITSADFAAESDDADTMQRVLGQIGQALLRASRLVNGLLAFSEGNQRADDLSDFTEIVTALADDLERDLEGSGIELHVELPSLPILPVPRAQMRTILRNISRNAIEAMPDGGRLGIQASLRPDELVIAISDTGVGMDEAVRQRAFEPFWTTKTEAQNKPGEPAGLGLAITHGLVQVLGGSIEITSERNRGTSIRIVIPRPA